MANATAKPSFTEADTDSDTAAVVVKPKSNAPVDISRGYSSIVGDDLETRKRVYTAVSNSEKIADHLNEPFDLVDILVQPVESENEDTGVVENYLRTTLVAADGTAYAAGSEGISNSVDTLLRALGEPSTWPAGGLKIQVVERKGKRGKFFSIEFV